MNDFDASFSSGDVANKTCSGNFRSSIGGERGPIQFEFADAGGRDMLAAMFPRNLFTRRWLAAGLFFCAALGLRAAPADYLVDKWDTEDSLPSSMVTSIAQTPDRTAICGWAPLTASRGSTARGVDVASVFAGFGTFANRQPGQTAARPTASSCRPASGD